jgi:hypothetical protein
MQIVRQPERKEWDKLLERPYVDNTAVLTSVQGILDEVRSKGVERGYSTSAGQYQSLSPGTNNEQGSSHYHAWY